jgi:hypothetical protein
MSVPLKANISRGNPDKVFDLIEKIGGGTYGDVFKVCGQFILITINCLTKFSSISISKQLCTIIF